MFKAFLTAYTLRTYRAEASTRWVSSGDTCS